MRRCRKELVILLVWALVGDGRGPFLQAWTGSRITFILILVSRVNNQFVYLPIKQAVSRRSHVDTEGSLWRDVLENTRQPFSMKN